MTDLPEPDSPTKHTTSPGSTLKPFLYGLALDTGAILPDSFLLDIPTDFAGYVAENYDDRYRGRVTARTALVESLNAPAVRLLSRVGVGRFLEFLRRGGLSTLDRPAGSYGLPLVLGAAEVSLLSRILTFSAKMRSACRVAGAEMPTSNCSLTSRWTSPMISRSKSSPPSWVLP